MTPIPVHRAALESHAPPVSPEGVPARLRRGVEQQVDAIAGSANKVISGVVDQGFGVLRALLPGTSTDPNATAPDGPNPDQEAAPWNAARPGFGLLRRESGFSIASLAASLPGRDRARSFGSTAATAAEESGQMMVDVSSSRPGSVRSVYGSDSESSAEDHGEDDGEDDDEQERDDDRHDTRSIRSFESMMGRAARRRRTRKSLSDRLASMPGLARLSGPQQPLVVFSFALDVLAPYLINLLSPGLSAILAAVIASSSSSTGFLRKSCRDTFVKSCGVPHFDAHHPTESAVFGRSCRRSSLGGSERTLARIQAGC